MVSTGASRVVDHFANVCVLCPLSVKDPCIALRTSTDVKRDRKAEHSSLVLAECVHSLLVLAPFVSMLHPTAHCPMSIAAGAIA